jgi:DNA-binding GntR family transcriptional regulator
MPHTGPSGVSAARGRGSARAVAARGARGPDLAIGGRGCPRGASADRAALRAQRGSRGARGIPGLHDAIAEQQRALANGGTGFIVADRRFHRAIVAANGNALLTRQYDTLRDRQQRIAATAVARDPARIVRFIAEHEELVAAIERGDPAAAAQLTAAQLTAAHLRGADALARRPRSLSATP